MSAPTGILKSSIVKKYWMAATGLFLCLFLVGHLAGNFQLFIPGEAGQLQFNEYAVFMTTNPLVKLLSYLTYASVLFHAIDGVILTMQNKKARPVQYAYNKPSANSIWSSRNMGILGTIMLVFIVMHMGQFWFKYKFGEVPYMETADGEKMKDLHTIVMAAFQQSWIVALYVISMVAMGFHLWHGFSSAFQSMGVNHPKYTPVIKKIGYAFAVLVPLGFAIIPIYLFVTL